jgi:predicted aspartyl protease
MPVVEMNFGGEAKREGKVSRLSGRDALSFLGPTLTVAISIPPEYQAKLQSTGLPIPSPVVGNALIDTGASKTAVDENVCLKLGLKPTSVIKMAHAGGAENRYCYPILIQLLVGISIAPILIPIAASVNLNVGKQPHILLIGRDFLSNIRMVYNGPMGRIELIF